jgi:hypothetical protein
VAAVDKTRLPAAVLLGALCWMAAACASHRPPPPIAGAGDVEVADSLDAIDDAVHYGAPAGGDVEVVAEAVSEAREDAGARAGTGARGGPAGSAGGGPYARCQVLEGYREAGRAEVGWRRGRSLVRVGVRRVGDRRGGFVELRGVGVVKRLAVGGLRPRLAEGVLLGVRYSPFVPTRSSPPRPGLSVTPTATVWNPDVGIAAEMAVGRFSVSLAGWREGGTGSEGETVYWTSLSRRSGSWLAGAAGGKRAGVGGVDGSIFAGWDTDRATAAAEVARFRGRVYAALRTVLRADGTWRLEAYNGPVPGGFSDATVGPDDVRRQQWGGAIHRTGSVRGVHATVSAYANVRRTSGSLKRRRRYETTARGRAAAGGRWEVSLRLCEDSESVRARETVDYEPESSHRRQWRVRAGWRSSGRVPFQQRYGIAAHADDGGVGVVTTIGWSYVGRRWEAGFAVNDYSIAQGQTGYVVRPGIAGYEVVSAVTRAGSDLSAYLAARWAGLRLRLYGGQPWRKPPRWYAELALSL